MARPDRCLDFSQYFHYSPDRTGPDTEPRDVALLVDNLSSPLSLRHLRVPAAVTEDLLESLPGTVSELVQTVVRLQDLLQKCSSRHFQRRERAL